MLNDAQKSTNDNTQFLSELLHIFSRSIGHNEFNIYLKTDENAMSSSKCVCERLLYSMRACSTKLLTANFLITFK